MRVPKRCWSSARVVAVFSSMSCSKPGGDDFVWLALAVKQPSPPRSDGR